jgi:uncharacterized protein YbbK (DUF523 family)
MEKVLVSACLLGARVRYHGGDARTEHPALARWREEERLVSVCPERDGGLPTPRPPAEIVGAAGGSGVIAKLAVVRTAAGADVTAAFLRGAEAALDAVRQHRIRIAILKDGSPSCGSGSIYNGTFSGTRVAGAGVTAAMLQAHGVRVFSEREIDAASAYLAALENAPRVVETETTETTAANGETEERRKMENS